MAKSSGGTRSGAPKSEIVESKSGNSMHYYGNGISVEASRMPSSEGNKDSFRVYSNLTEASISELKSIAKKKGGAYSNEDNEFVMPTKSAAKNFMKDVVRYAKIEEKAIHESMNSGKDTEEIVKRMLKNKKK